MSYRYRLLILFGLLCLFCFGLVPARLFQLQVLHGTDYRERVAERGVRKDRSDAPRGKIRARDLEVLATELPAYDLQIRFRAVRDEQALVGWLAAVVERPPEELRERLDAMKQVAVAEQIQEAGRATRKGLSVPGVRFRLAGPFPGPQAHSPSSPWDLPPGLSIEERRERHWGIFHRPAGVHDLWVDFRTLADRPEGLDAVARTLGLDRGAIEEALVQAREKMTRAALRRAPWVTLATRLSFAQMARITCHEDEFPGLRVVTRSVRHYPQGPLAGQILGSLGAPQPDQLRDLVRDSEDPELRWWAESGTPPDSTARFYRALHRDLARLGLTIDSLVGRSGVEMIMEPSLRGEPGHRVVERDVRNRTQDVLVEVSPRPGYDVILTLDARLQRAVEQEFDRPAGAAVVLDVRTGEILAVASFPRVDPNELVPPVSPETARRLFPEEGPAPTFNRALGGFYPPGSVFKILTSLCALEEGIVDPGRPLECLGPLSPADPKRFRCWQRRGHGPVALSEAIQRSCNVFFFKCADQLGPERLIQWAAEFGFGERVGTELRASEGAGLLPTPAWKRRVLADTWYAGDTRNLSIGQGALMVNPLQIARMMAAVANGGNLVTPHIVQRVVDAEGNPVPWGADPRASHARKLGLCARSLDAVRKGLADVVNAPGGTAHRAFTGCRLPYRICGKTSTAQSGRAEGNVGWFAGFAPADAPRIAFAVVVEGLQRAGEDSLDEEHGGDVAAPILRRILERYEDRGDAASTASLSRR